MQRISAAWFADLGAVLVPLVNSFGGPNEGRINVFDLHRVREYLVLLADEKTYPLDLRASRPVIQQLLFSISAVLNEPIDKQADKLEHEKLTIWGAAQRLVPLLSGELAVQPIYHLWPVRAYNIEVLVSQGQNLFSQAAQSAFNEEEVNNFQEAGKCLAFQIPTAAAFHIFRGAEFVDTPILRSGCWQAPETKNEELRRLYQKSERMRRGSESCVDSGAS